MRAMKKYEFLEQDMRRILSMKADWNEFQNAAVLVTGATGLIGSMVCRTLSRLSVLKQWNMTILALARNVEKAEETLADVTENGNILFLQQDVTERLHTEGPVDFIIHTASPTKSQFFVNQPVETLQSIITGTVNILELAKEKNSRSVVYLSSMEAYGQVTEEKLLGEEQLGYINPVAPRSSYPEGKRAAEAFCAAYAKEYGIPVKIVRLAQTFGPGIPADDNRVFVQFYRSASAGEDIVMYTTGGSKHMYIDTMDAVSATLLLLTEGESGQVYNVANDDNYCSIKEMAELVIAVFGNGTNSLRIDTSKNTGQYPAEHKLKLDVSKLKALGWEAQYDMKQMYRRMIEDMQEDARW